MKRAATAASRRLTISYYYTSQSGRFPTHPQPNIQHAVSNRDLTTASILSNGVTLMTSFLKDVVRTGSLNPPNPILQSLDFPKDADPNDPTGSSSLESLPKFSHVSPYHLKKAAKRILQNFNMQLAELEVHLTNTSEESFSSSSLLSEMDRLQAPLTQIREISTLYTLLAANPDQIQAWKEVTTSPFVKQVIAMAGHSSPLYQSTIVYQALTKSVEDSSDPCFVPFYKQGMHLTDANTEEKEQLPQIQQELQIIQDRLQQLPSYEHASKAVRLQCVSDMYNCLGLTRLQAQMIGYTSVREMSQKQHLHMNTDRLKWRAICDDVSNFLQPFLPRHTKLNLEGAGAFLDDSNRPGNVAASTPEEQLAVLKAKYDFKQCMRLHGVLQGIVDFCDAILGIRVVEDTVAKQEGWSKNARLLHLYEKKGDDSADNQYLGTIYWDPFADAYWRTDEAEDLVMTRLFSRNVQQTVAPVAVMALKIRPTWDDAPALVGWDDTRDLLFHFGNAMQMILVQASQRRNLTLPKSPVDASEFLGHFMEMWLQNDGFVYRLVQLSQDENYLGEETLKVLRNQLKREKALEIVNTIFLSELQQVVLDDFDPRGDETLVALQGRLAQQYLPKGNLPDSTDLSPLLTIFKEYGAEQSLATYSPLWSEVLSATVYEAFQKTDLRDKDKVVRLGKGTRNLFLRSDGQLTIQAITDLCALKPDDIVGGPLQRVYGFVDETLGDEMERNEEDKE
ncbi:peptidase M3 family protein [Nitzschia inconspicua]|uniref:Peptidase M3 family protein n=1 Tax=Nitzschia inconspicua TaxID=303405 RepID=A0A9K3M3Q0_9STRA|nr:peptidase M3 family protein [Nitzschia inconspicua]